MGMNWCLTFQLYNNDKCNVNGQASVNKRPLFVRLIYK